MLEHLRRNAPTLRSTLLLIVLLCWLLPTVTLGVSMGTRVLESLRLKTDAALRTGAEYALSMAVRNIDNVTTLARDAVYDTVLNTAVQNLNAGTSPYEDYYLLVRDYLDRKFSRVQSCTFALFFREGETEQPIYTSQGYSAAVLFLQNAKAQALTLADTLDTRARFFASGDDVYLVRNLLNTHMQRYGTLVLGLNLERILAPLYRNAADWNATVAIRLDDVQLGAPVGDDGVTGLQEVANQLCYTLDATVSDSTLRYQLQADRHQVYREMDDFRLLLLGLMILFIPLCAAVLVFVNRRIVRPIDMLSDASDRIRSGELGVVVPMRGNDELGHLGVAFSEMSLRLKELIERSYKEEIALRDARIQALQSRINPHFLNNALEAINWQARMDGAGTVGEMVETLSVLLNASLDRSEQRLVPLRQELNIVDAYFYFVRLQFGDRLTIQRFIDPALLDVPLPRLVVQTLIENAVEHGVAPAGGGRITLSVFARGDQLRIEVLNNGARLTETQLAALRAMLADSAPADGRLGIRNVNQRLRLIFGEQAGLEFSQDAHGNTVATIRQPLHPSAQTQTTGRNP